MQGMPFQDFCEGRELGPSAQDGDPWGGRRYRITDSQPLGVGAGSSVYEAVDKKDGCAVAVKVIDRLEVDGDDSRTQLLEREINIWNKLKHPNIINLLEVVFEDDWVLLVIEYAGGGSLYSILAGEAGAVPESRARVLFQQMLAAVEYCNGNGIYHRDLKLENVVFGDPSEMTDILHVVKLTDFGASKDSGVGSAPKSKVGTIAYMAPEVVDVTRVGASHTYDGAADIWSLGVILYVMCTQRYPFGFDGAKRDGGVSAAVVYRRIRQGWPAGVDGGIPRGISSDLAELFAGMLDPNPEARWGCEQIRGCQWLSSIAPYQPLIPPPFVVPELRMPGRLKPRSNGGKESYGSFGSLGFGGFPSFSGNDGLLSLSLPREGSLGSLGKFPSFSGGLESSYDVLDTSIDSLNGEAAGLEISDSPGTPPEYGLLSSVKPVRLPTSWESRGEGSPTTAHGPPAWEEEGPPQDLYM